MIFLRPELESDAIFSGSFPGPKWTFAIVFLERVIFLGLEVKISKYPCVFFTCDIMIKHVQSFIAWIDNSSGCIAPPVEYDMCWTNI